MMYLMNNALLSEQIINKLVVVCIRFDAHATFGRDLLGNRNNFADNALTR